MKKQPPKILIILIALVILVLTGRAVVMNSTSVQNFIVERALAAQFSAAGRALGGDNLDIVFCGVGSPMGQGGAQSCIGVFAGDKFFIVDAGARSAALMTGCPWKKDAMRSSRTSITTISIRSV